MELDMWADLDVHTSSTLVAAEKKLLQFSTLLKVSLSAEPPGPPGFLDVVATVPP